MRKFLPVVVIVGLVAVISQRFQRTDSAPAAVLPESLAELPLEVERPAATEKQAFRCDGRTRCPQMTSCEEAEYFIQHCPDTKMDGDLDGVPCEDQWCSHKR